MNPSAFPSARTRLVVLVLATSLSIGLSFHVPLPATTRGVSSGSNSFPIRASKDDGSSNEKSKESAQLVFTVDCDLSSDPLPAGTTLVAPVTLGPDDSEIRFPIMVTPDALTGLTKNIACAVAITANGQPITQISGDGTLRIDPERTQ